MQAQELTGEPAGWYPDPRYPRSQRWWDGNEWTNRTRYEAKDVVAHPLTAAKTVAEPEPKDERPERKIRDRLLIGLCIVVMAVLVGVAISAAVLMNM